MEILVVLALGLLVLGPERLHTVVGHVARAKARFEEASRGLKSQLSAELDAVHQGRKPDGSHELAGLAPKEYNGKRLVFWELGKAFSRFASDADPWVPSALEVTMHANIFARDCERLSDFVEQYEII